MLAVLREGRQLATTQVAVVNPLFQFSPRRRPDSAHL